MVWRPRPGALSNTLTVLPEAGLMPSARPAICFLN